MARTWRVGVQIGPAAERCRGSVCPLTSAQLPKLCRKMGQQLMSASRGLKCLGQLASQRVV